MDSEQKLRNAAAKKRWAQDNPKKVKIACWRQKIKLVNCEGNLLTIEEWGELYEKWVSTETCECCGKTFDQSFKKSYNDKQLDHCHKTMKFRNFLCNKCNKIRAYVDTDYQTIMKLMSM
tara:strand:- start:331 stop:687 length:357 start_codon:yes stop_codon:yes gene_type:complete